MIKLVVFDMAGTTIEDDNVVEDAFFNSTRDTGLDIKRSQIKACPGTTQAKGNTVIVDSQSDRSGGD